MGKDIIPGQRKPVCLNPTGGKCTVNRANRPVGCTLVLTLAESEYRDNRHNRSKSGNFGNKNSAIPFEKPA